MNDRYIISDLRDGSAGRWDAFVEKEGGTFFHLSGWKRIFEDSLRHPARYLMCEVQGEIVGVLPLVQVKSWLFGNALVSLPFLVYGGPVVRDKRAERLLTEAAQAHGAAINADYLELRSREPSDRGWPTRATHAYFSKSIDSDPEENLRAIPRKQRAMIRKGIMAGLNAQSDEGVDRLYTALLDSKRNLGTPFFDARFLKDVKLEFGDRAEILTIVKNNDVVASVMSFRFRNEILPYYGGGRRIARHLAANDFMYWAVMEKACTDGVEVFDFGRSMIGSGAYRFKKHWGFEPIELPYEFLPIGKDELPELNPSNPKYRLLINAWKKLPLAVAGRLGPPLARRLG